MATAALPPQAQQLQANMVAWILRYHDAPELFVREVIGADPDPKQCLILGDIAAGKRRISVRSGHRVGKSTVASWAAIWFICTRFPVKVVITAPSSNQLFDALFAELKRWFRKLPAELRSQYNETTERIELLRAPAESFISCRTSRAETPEALAGVHSENVLLIGDEASGIPEQVFEAAAGSMAGTNVCTLLLGNPVRSSGYFYDTHHPKPESKTKWVMHHLSSVDCPRVSREYIDEIAEKYGRESNTFRIRVLGEFPLADSEAVIAAELVEAARSRDIELDKSAPMVWGIDVARYGDDYSCICKRKGHVIPEKIKSWGKRDLMALAGWIQNEYLTTPDELKPVEICADVIGVGAGLVDRLIQLKLPVTGINVSESPAMKGEYLNLRAELWLAGRDWFNTRACKIPNDDDFITELLGVRYRVRESDGKVQIESKDDMRKRGVRSPNRADAFILTFASDAAAAIHGWSHHTRRKGPLKRGVKRLA